MEPTLPSQQFFLSLEERLLQPAVRQSASALEELLAEEFIEFGRSGQIFNRQQTLEMLLQEPLVPLAYGTITGFQVLVLGPGIVLSTYHVTQDDPEREVPLYSLRSSVWKLIDGHWKILFHQGTLTQQGPSA